MIIKVIPNDEYRKKISVVCQDIHLFKGTVHENITLGGDVRVDAQGHLWFCTEMIEAWKEKYETQVGDGGAKLSGGERQKIALLRALGRKSQILVLDEPTSNYDKESEEGFNRFMRENNDYDFYFIVTHREEVTDFADKIISVKDGAATVWLRGGWWSK